MKWRLRHRSLGTQDSNPHKCGSLLFSYKVKVLFYKLCNLNIYIFPPPFIRLLPMCRKTPLSSVLNWFWDRSRMLKKRLNVRSGAGIFLVKINAVYVCNETTGIIFTQHSPRILKSRGLIILRRYNPPCISVELQRQNTRLFVWLFSLHFFASTAFIHFLSYCTLLLTSADPQNFLSGLV